MTTETCTSPLDWPTLLAYWLGEQDPDSEARTEEHYLGCVSCSQRLNALASLAEQVRAVAQAGGLEAVVTDQFVRRQEEHGRHVRTYRVPHNGAVNCTVAPEDHLVAARLEAPLAGVTRLDLVQIGPDGKREMRREDIPFVAESGSVVIATNLDVLRALPASTLRMRLLAVDRNGERIIGEYTFNHTP